MKKIKEYLYQIFYTRKVKINKCDNESSWYLVYFLKNCKLSLQF